MPEVAGSFYKVVFEHLHLSVQTMSWAFWTTAPGSTDPTSAQSFADSLGDIYEGSPFATTYINALNPATNLRGIRVYEYSPNTGVLSGQGFHSLGNNGNGSQNNPPQCALVVTLRTAGFGRAFRGRCYIPYTGGATIAGGILAGGGPAVYAAAFATFFDEVNALEPVQLISRSRGVAQPITAVSVDQVVDTQQRRRDKVQGLRSTVTLT